MYLYLFISWKFAWRRQRLQAQEPLPARLNGRTNKAAPASGVRGQPRAKERPRGSSPGKDEEAGNSCDEKAKMFLVFCSFCFWQHLQLLVLGSISVFSLFTTSRYLFMCLIFGLFM
jgi:hypothetical protein